MGAWDFVKKAALYSNPIGLSYVAGKAAVDAAGKAIGGAVTTDWRASPYEPDPKAFRARSGMMKEDRALQGQRGDQAMQSANRAAIAGSNAAQRSGQLGQGFNQAAQGLEGMIGQETPQANFLLANQLASNAALESQRGAAGLSQAGIDARQGLRGAGSVLGQSTAGMAGTQGLLQQSGGALGMGNAELANSFAARQALMGQAGVLGAMQAGQTPSIAEMQLQRSGDQALAQQAALAASARGGNIGAARRGAMDAQAGIQADISGQAAMLRAQEQQAATGQLNQLLGGIRSGDMAAAQGYQAAAGQLAANAGVNTQAMGQIAQNSALMSQNAQAGFGNALAQTQNQNQLAGILQQNAGMHSGNQQFIQQSGLQAQGQQLAAQQALMGAYGNQEQALGNLALGYGNQQLGFSGLARDYAALQQGGAQEQERQRLAAQIALQQLLAQQSLGTQSINANIETGNASNLAQLTGATIETVGTLGGYATRASDRRVKTKVRRASGETSKASPNLRKLGEWRYEYKDSKYGKGEFVGPMAQEFERDRSTKDLVVERDGVKMIDTGRLALRLASAYAEQQRRLDKIENGRGRGSRV